MSSDPKTDTPAAEPKVAPSASKAEAKPAAAVEGEDGEGDGKISKSAGGLSQRIGRLQLTNSKEGCKSCGEGGQAGRSRCYYQANMGRIKEGQEGESKD